MEECMKMIITKNKIRNKHLTSEIFVSKKYYVHKEKNKIKIEKDLLDTLYNR